MENKVENFVNFFFFFDVVVVVVVCLVMLTGMLIITDFSQSL